MSAPRQRIRLAIRDIAAKHYEVRHRIDGIDSDAVELTMPVWVPGSYVLREYAGLVATFEAHGSGGTPLVATKTDKATWRVECDGNARLEVVYVVFAPELTVRNNDITEGHAFVHPPATFMALKGHEKTPIEIEVNAPGGWRVHTALEARDGVYLAENYDRLADCPFEIGPFDAHRFDVAGKPHEFVVYGSGNHDIDRILSDTEKIVAHEIDFFGGEAPYERYLFILHLVHDRGGGLEHDDSTVLAWPKLGFRPEKEYREFLTLVAHEFFHVWNVKRIRPEVLLDYEYTNEVYTRLLWVFEGWTTYFDELIPARAGCYGAREMLQAFARHIQTDTSRPGGLVQSLSDSSFDTWIKLYRANPDTQNTQANYYLKGLLVGLLLDLHLREKSEGTRSLDDVMRYLWSEIAQKGRGVPEGGMPSIIREATGVEVTDFIRKHVDEPVALDFDHALATVGLQLRRKKKSADDPEKAYFGATFEPIEGATRLGTVFHGGPAHRGGLMAGDEVLSLDGHKVGRDLGKRLELHRPGEAVRWTAFRRDRLVEGELQFTEDPVGELEIVPLETASDQQKAAFQSWSHSPFDALVESSKR